MGTRRSWRSTGTRGCSRRSGHTRMAGPLIVLQVAVVIPAAGGAGRAKVREAQMRTRAEGVRSTMRTCRPGAGPITMEPQFPVIPGLDIVEIAEAVGNCATVLYNEDNYAKLPEDLQTVLRECMDQIREKNNEITRDEDAYYIEKMKAEVPGLTVTESDYGSLLLWAVRSMRSWSPASLMKRSAMQSKPWPEQGRFPPCKGLVWETNGTLAENTGAPTEVKLIKKYMRHFPWPLCMLLSAGLMRDIIQPGGKCDNAPPGRAIFSLSLCRLCGKLDISRRRTGCSRGYRSAPGRLRHLHPVEAPASA